MKQRTIFRSAKAGEKEDCTSIRYPNFILTAVAITDTGYERESNEDNYAMDLDHDPLTDNHHALFVVADGLGGHALGDEASAIVCDTHIQSPRDTLAELAKRSHALVKKLENAGISPPGSTEVALRITPDEKELHFHVGDSRLYCFNRTYQSLEQLTEDDSIAWQEYRAGRLRSKDDVRLVAYKNIVTACIGVSGFSPTRTSSPPQKIFIGDVYLLCSDGLWDELSDAHIQDILQTSYKTAPNNHKAAANALVNAALNEGGNDNITVLLVGIDAVPRDNRESHFYTQAKELLAKKQDHAAEVCLHEVLLRNPKNSWAHYLLGMFYTTSSIMDPQAAAYHFHSALRIRPAFATKDLDEALGFITNNNYTKALWAIERAGEIAHYSDKAPRQKIADTANNVGVAFKDGTAGNKDYTAAKRAFDAALATDADNVDAHYHLGTIAFMQKDYGAAKGHLCDVVQRKPTHRWAQYQLGRVCEATGNPEARNHYQIAADLGLEQAQAALQKVKRGS